MFGDWTFDRERFTLTLADEEGTLTFGDEDHGQTPSIWLTTCLADGLVTSEQACDLVEALVALGWTPAGHEVDGPAILKRERYELARRLFMSCAHTEGAPRDMDEGMHLKIECIREVDEWFGGVWA